jgi:hypothetical protein
VASVPVPREGAAGGLAQLQEMSAVTGMTPSRLRYPVLRYPVLRYPVLRYPVLRRPGLAWNWRRRACPCRLSQAISRARI